MTKEQAEKFFGRKASPDSNLSMNAFLKKKANDMVMSKGMGKVLDSKVGKVGIKVGNVVLNRKNNLVNNIANLLSYPAQKKAQKSIIESDKKLKDIKMQRVNNPKPATIKNGIYEKGGVGYQLINKKGDVYPLPKEKFIPHVEGPKPLKKSSSGLPSNVKIRK